MSDFLKNFNWTERKYFGLSAIEHYVIGCFIAIIVTEVFFPETARAITGMVFDLFGWERLR